MKLDEANPRILALNVTKLSAKKCAYYIWACLTKAFSETSLSTLNLESANVIMWCIKEE